MVINQDRERVAGSSSDCGNRWRGLAVTALICVALSACVAGSSESHHAVVSGGLSQFLVGLWHGIIAPLTLIIEVVNHFAPRLLPWSVHFFEASDTGLLYDIGFYLGLVGSPLFASSRFR